MDDGWINLHARLLVLATMSACAGEAGNAPWDSGAAGAPSTAPAELVTSASVGALTALTQTAVPSPRFVRRFYAPVLQRHPLDHALTPRGDCATTWRSPSFPNRTSAKDVRALASQVDAGNPCAARELAEFLVESAGLVADYEHAVSLAAAAQDVGVTPWIDMCLLFDLAGDRQRFAACNEQDTRRAALSLAYGDGVARDVARARVLADSSFAILPAVDTVSALRDPGQVRFCEVISDAAWSMADTRDCLTEELLERDVVTAAARAKWIAAFPDPSRYELLHQQFITLRDADLMRRMLSIHGSLAGWFGIGRRYSLHILFDDILRHLARAEVSVCPTRAKLMDLERHVARLERENLGAARWVSELDGPDSARAYLRRTHETHQAFRALSDTVATLTRDWLGPDAVAAIRIKLLADRVIAYGPAFRN